MIATGHGSMSGISQGPMTGRLCAELCLGTPPSLPLAPFSPDRWRATALADGPGGWSPRGPRSLSYPALL